MTVEVNVVAPSMGQIEVKVGTLSIKIDPTEKVEVENIYRFQVAVTLGGKEIYYWGTRDIYHRYVQHLIDKSALQSDHKHTGADVAEMWSNGTLSLPAAVVIADLVAEWIEAYTGNGYVAAGLQKIPLVKEIRSLLSLPRKKDGI